MKTQKNWNVPTAWRMFDFSSTMYLLEQRKRSIGSLFVRWSISQQFTLNKVTSSYALFVKATHKKRNDDLSLPVRDLISSLETYS